MVATGQFIGHGPGELEGRVLPSAALLEAAGQPRGERQRARGCGSPAVKGEQVRCGGARGGDRGVPGEQLRPVPAQPQGPRGDEEFRCLVQERRRTLTGVERGEGAPSGAEVERPPVVRVGQRAVPEFGALVNVRHAGHGELHELGAE